MKYLMITLLLNIFLVMSAQAEPVPYQTIQGFHEKRIQTLVENYGLKNQVEASVIISPKEMKSLNKEQRAKKKIRLPGLLLGGIESTEKNERTVGIFEILDSLGDYQRDVTIVKKERVSDEEIEALKAAIKDKLVLRDDEAIKVEDKVFSMAKAMKNWQADIQQAMYTTLFKTGYWAWIPLSLFVFFLLSVFVSSAMKKAFGGLGQSLEKSAVVMSGQAQEEAERESFEKQESDYGDVVETEVDSLFEIDPEMMLQRVIALYEKSRNELFSILWQNLPTTSKQLSFYEAMSQSQDHLSLEIFKNLFFECFSFSPQSISNMKNAEFLTGNELDKINKLLLCAQLVPNQERREQALAVIFPSFGDKVDEVIQHSVEEHFEIVYYLFPEKVVQTIKKNPEFSKKASSKVAFYLSKNEEDKLPGELEIKKFKDFLQENKKVIFGEESGVKLDNNLTEIIYNIPDTLIFSDSSWSPEVQEQIKVSIPNLRWVNATDSNLLKKFFLSLNEEEMKYVSESHLDYVSLYNALDERGQIRVSEKLDKASRQSKEVNVAMLRRKIKTYFKSYTEESSAVSGGEDDFSYAA